MTVVCCKGTQEQQQCSEAALSWSNNKKILHSFGSQSLMNIITNINPAKLPLFISHIRKSKLAYDRTIMANIIIFNSIGVLFKLMLSGLRE